MLGAIIGDVAGSYYEVLEINNIKSGRSYEDRIKVMDKSVELFDDNSSVTDDSILTMAIYDAVINGKDYEETIKEYALRELELGLDMYGRSRFSPGFVKWVNGDFQGNSYGTGAAMRVSPIGFLYDDIDEIKKEVYKASTPSHNDAEAIKGAEAVAVSIFLLRNGMNKNDLLKYIEKNYYDLSFDLEELRHNYRFYNNTRFNVPQALFVFLNSDSFEDSIRKAISIGGDSDTIASMVGALSEAYYGVDERMINKVKPYLKDYMFDLLKDRYYNRSVFVLDGR